MHPSFVPALSSPIETQVLVALLDQYHFLQNARGRPPLEVFAELDGFYRIVERVVDETGGLVIKFLGDGVLLIFPKELANPGILALMRLKDEVESWMHKRRIQSGLHVNVHSGPVAMGKLGSIDRLDVIGEAVNVCATLPHRGVTLSQQAFRRLKPENRRAFQRFSPPITYHPLERTP